MVHQGFRHRPLFAYRHPRSVSAGQYGYVFRREAGCETSFDTNNRRFPTLYVTEKIKDKAGMVFFNCPHFKSLRDNDIPMPGGFSKDEIEDLSKNGKLRLRTLDKKADKMVEKEKQLKERRKEQRDPSIKNIRNHIKKIIRYHSEKVQEQVPSIYPLLGPANTDSENSDDEDGVNAEKRQNTKKELKRRIS